MKLELRLLLLEKLDQGLGVRNPLGRSRQHYYVDTRLKDLKRLQSYLIEMSHLENDARQGILEDVNTEANAEVFVSTK